MGKRVVVGVVVGAVGWRDRLLETAPVPNRFLPSSDLLQKPGEERRRTCTRAIHVYVRRRRLGVVAVGNRSTLHTRLFIFLSWMNQTRKGSYVSLIYNKFTNIAPPCTKFISRIVDISRKLDRQGFQGFFFFSRSNRRNDFECAGARRDQHLENGRGIFRSVSGNVCKVTSGNSRAGATRSASPCARDGGGGGGMLEQELSRAVARDTARNPVRNCGTNEKRITRLLLLLLLLFLLFPPPSFLSRHPFLSSHS